jgi:periplasmic protein TonB
MKKILFLALAFCVFQSVQSQNTKENPSGNLDNNIYNSAAIEVKPEFPGGIAAFYKFIGANYKTPDVAGLKGKLIIAFVVDKDGSLTDIKILRDIGFGTGTEAVRVLKLSPKWIPAEQNGQTVRCAFTLPINIETSK